MNRFLSRVYLFSLVMTIVAAVAALPASGQAAPQDIPIGVTYICNGEHIYIENCNIRDTSDTSNCMVAHPDHLTPTGLNSYTYVSRGALKKLLPTCTQPSAKQVAAAKAFQQKQQDLYNANVQKAEQQMKAPSPTSYQQGGAAQVTPPKNAEERAMRRCVSSGRLPSSCTGNSLLGMFSGMISQILPGADKTPAPGPVMAGVFQGAGWRLDFIDGGVLVNCSFLSPNQESYSIKFEPNRTALIIDTRPKPLNLTFHPDGTISGPGPVTIQGVVAGGYTPGTSTPGHTETQSYNTTERMNANMIPGGAANANATYAGGGTYDVTTTHTSSTYVPGQSTPGTTSFVPRTATCPALNLTSKGAGVGIQTMQTDLLKTAFGGDKGPPTPAGIRMHGIFAASTGFSVEFYPESAILGCGPDAARAYPYTVMATGGGAQIKVEAPDHPLILGFNPDGSLVPTTTGPYQVHGRIVTGQDDNDDFTFAPMEQTCNLAALSPSKTIPMSGGSATMMSASATGSATGTGTGPANGGGTLSTSSATLGNATFTIVSGFPATPGQVNPLANHPYVLLRKSFNDTITQSGVNIPAGTTPFKFLGLACGNRTPDCQTIMNAIKAGAVSSVRADVNGGATFPGVPPGTYYLMISTRFNNQALVWLQAVRVNAGSNSMTLDARNATAIN
ncbi:hypothetical protein P8935_07490 [Telmatobacter sp. DSM 110680]|uniref:Uncharacterized protein n=1 Tax=Telmatobacter sp. DSM 110680 TaxID=3036704 RepID=A0AAU7DQ35_9BACT